MRQVLLGKNNPASYPTFTRKVAYRGLVPMDRAVAVLGEEKAHNQCMHTGPNAHVLNFPVGQHKFMNVVAFVTEAEWPHGDTLVAPSTRQELVAAFKDWNPAVRAIVGLLEEPMDKWAIFDTYENPLPFFAKGRIGLAGDAAHAASPHHGAGAGFGIEDALALSSVLEDMQSTIKQTQTDKYNALSAAFQAYDSARRERGQWLVRSSREVCETYEWSNPDCGADPAKCVKDIEWRAHKVWYFNIDGMIENVRTAYRELAQPHIVP